MILALNIGNTHITFGLIKGKDISDPVMNIKTDRKKTSYEYASEIKQIFELCSYSASDVEGAIISSVVPPMTQIIKNALKLLIGIEPLVVGVGLKSGIHIHTDDPGSVASDLVAMAAAAKEEHKLPCVIVDMGTAATFTVVDEKGRFIGGAFMPGAHLSLDALVDGASLLPRIDISSPKKAISSSTAECMRSGIVYGYAGAVDGIIDKFASELGREPATVVVTGGIAEYICRYTKRECITDEHLLLKGLGYIYSKNQ